MTGFGKEEEEEEEDGVAAAACLPRRKCSEHLVNLDWWTRRYRLGYAMGGGMAGEDLGKQCLWNIGLRSVENHLLMGM